MPFGVDGILINSGGKRLYSAKALSHCDIYRIKYSLVRMLISN
jgi:hypothetical protein